MLIDEELHRKICESYLRLGTFKAVGREFGISPYIISKEIRAEGLIESTFEDRNALMTKGKEVFWYEDKVLGYLCGLIASDGCLTKGKRIILTLTASDSKTLETFKNCAVLNPDDCPIIYRTPKSHLNVQPVGTMALVLPRLYDFCLSIGITPAKTYTLDVNLDGQTDEFKWYFLRGFIDGDGCVFVKDRLGACKVEIYTASTKLAETFKRVYGADPLSDYRTEYGRDLRWHGRKAKQLASKLPLDDFCMERKTENLKILLQKPIGISSPQPSNPLMGELWVGFISEDLTQRDIWQRGGGAAPYYCIYSRMAKGWSLEEAIKVPFKWTREKYYSALANGVDLSVYQGKYLDYDKASTRDLSLSRKPKPIKFSKLELTSIKEEWNKSGSIVPWRTVLFRLKRGMLKDQAFTQLVREVPWLTGNKNHAITNKVN